MMKISQLMPTLTWLAFSFLICTFSLGVFAESYETTNFRNKTVSREEFIDALKPEQSAKPGQFQFRGLGLSGSTAAKKAASLELKFEFDSYRLTPQAKATLDNLGAALSSKELSDSIFVIEGYTDAKGSEGYNLGLSRQRAESVKNYLVSKHGVASSRLETRGFGESGLLDETNPYAGQNRRVQIVNIK